MSPNRQAGPRTVLSFHSPANAARSAITASSTSIGARPVAAARRASSARLRQHPAGRDRQVLARPWRPRRAATPSSLGDGRVAASSSASSATIGRPAAARRRATAPRTARSTSAMRRAQRPPSNVASAGSCSRREAIDPSRAGDRLGPLGRPPTQNSASAARVGTRRAEVDLRQRGATITGGGRARRAPTRPWRARAVGTPRVVAGRRAHARCRRPSPSRRPVRRRRAGGRRRWPRRPGAADAERRHGRRGGRRQVAPSAAATPHPVQPLDGRRPERRAAPGPRAHPRRGRWRARRRPSATASSRPGTPTPAVGAPTSIGSRSASSSRRYTTSIGSSPPSVRSHTRPLAHDEVGAFDEVDAELHGRGRVLDVRRMVDAAGEQHDARARRRSTWPPARGAARPGTG